MEWMNEWMNGITFSNRIVVLLILERNKYVSMDRTNHKTQRKKQQQQQYGNDDRTVLANVCVHVITVFVLTLENWRFM